MRGIGALSRWQKTGAAIPLVILIAAGGIAAADPDFASSPVSNADIAIPSVPETAFDEPASIEQTPLTSLPAGLDPRQSGSEVTTAALSTEGIPNTAISAYQRAENLLAQADPQCRLSWQLIAAIARVESNHGRVNANKLDSTGTVSPGIFGPQLDGSNGTATITDTDAGRLDGDPVYDRAVGPLQFIPGTWSAVGVDANNDGAKDPQNIYDAATAAGIYLCAGAGDLSTDEDRRSAVMRYNHSSSYADTVTQIADSYASGDFTNTSSGELTAGENTTTTDSSEESTTAGGEQSATLGSQDGAVTPDDPAPTTSAPSASPDPTPAPTEPSPAPSSPPAPSPQPGSSGSVSDLVNGVVSDLTPTPAGQEPAPILENTLSWVDAKTRCLGTGISELDLIALTTCITDLIG